MDVFNFDKDYDENEKNLNVIKAEILGENINPNNQEEEHEDEDEEVNAELEKQEENKNVKIFFSNYYKNRKKYMTLMKQIL